MKTTLTQLPDYLEQMVEENCLLRKEALIVGRLPDDLQGKAIELSEAQRVQTMEQIASDLLRPKPQVTQPLAQIPPNLRDKVISIMALLCTLFIFYAVLFWVVYGIGFLIRPWFPGLYAFMQ